MLVMVRPHALFGERCHPGKEFDSRPRRRLRTPRPGEVDDRGPSGPIEQFEEYVV
jgi:hypothetical protein